MWRAPRCRRPLFGTRRRVSLQEGMSLVSGDCAVILGNAPAKNSLVDLVGGRVGTPLCLHIRGGDGGRAAPCRRRGLGWDAAGFRERAKHAGALEARAKWSDV